jgi:hypothetical protein
MRCAHDLDAVCASGLLLVFLILAVPRWRKAFCRSAPKVGRRGQRRLERCAPAVLDRQRLQLAIVILQIALMHRWHARASLPMAEVAAAKHVSRLSNVINAMRGLSRAQGPGGSAQNALGQTASQPSRPLRPEQRQVAVAIHWLAHMRRWHARASLVMERADDAKLVTSLLSVPSATRGSRRA